MRKQRRKRRAPPRSADGRFRRRRVKLKTRLRRIGRRAKTLVR